MNLPEHAREVYRGPEPDPAAPFRWRYRSALVMEPGASAAALARPDRHIQVRDLLP